MGRAVGRRQVGHVGRIGGDLSQENKGEAGQQVRCVVGQPSHDGAATAAVEQGGAGRLNAAHLCCN